jgi:hypothetical protein
MAEVSSGSTATRWTGYVMTILPSLFLLLDGVMKLFKPRFVVEATMQLGYQETIQTKICCRSHNAAGIPGERDFTDRNCPGNLHSALPLTYNFRTRSDSADGLPWRCSCNSCACRSRVFSDNLPGYYWCADLGRTLL